MTFEGLGDGVWCGETAKSRDEQSPPFVGIVEGVDLLVVKAVTAAAPIIDTGETIGSL